jgi:NtrC-family two-component system sensor histidine kinase KinB
MFGLRQKILLIFGGLLVILVVFGTQSLLHISRLGGMIDIILRENYQSVLACQQMKEAAERIDSGLLFVLLGENEQGSSLIARNSRAFEAALSRELGNVTLPGEGAKARTLSGLYARFKQSLALVTDTARPMTDRRAAYFTLLFPVFGEIKKTADEILQMNQLSMVEANERARRRAALAKRQMIILFAAEALLVLLLVPVAGRWILRPIQTLTRSAEEIRRGNLDFVVESRSRDEIGRLSESFNAMAAGLRELRRTGQARLARIQRATQEAFNGLPEAEAVVDLEGTVEVSTESARSIFGLRPGVSIFGLPDAFIADLFRLAIKGSRFVSLPGEQTPAQRFVGGEERYFRPEAGPILDDLRRPTGVILHFRDVTQLRQQDEIKRGVIRTVSHQLRTPLTSVRMAIHLLLEEKVGPLTEKQAELLVAARDDSDRLSAILSNLLDLSRIEAGRAALDLRPTSPSLMVQEATEAVRRTAQDQGLTFDLDVPADLPEVWADTSRMGHVFGNLLSNALKYTPPGGRITISARAEDKLVAFSVADTGPGIPREYLARVFELFFRVPEQGKETGAGLGLAIVKEIIEAHGGTVGVESPEGGGAVFTFRLRRADIGTLPEEEA